jgi:hypothetical protein
VRPTTKGRNRVLLEGLLGVMPLAVLGAAYLLFKNVEALGEASPVTRDRVLLAGLLGLFALCWAYLV